MNECSITDEVLSKFWDLIYEKLKDIPSISDFVEFSDKQESEKRFLSNVLNNERVIHEEFMKKGSNGLDRHKQAAILIISTIQAKPVTEKRADTGKVFIWQAIPVAFGLSYMLDQLNRRIKDKGIEHDPIKGYNFPIPMSCNTEYLIVLGRNLLYADKHDEWVLNPIDLANTLFLVEYITLLSEKIDPADLREY